MKKTLLLHVEERGCGSLHSQSTLSYLHQLQSLASSYGRKLMLIMKWSVFIIGMICLTSATLVAEEVKGQSDLEKKITLTIQEEPFKTALDKISTVSQVRFTYSDKVARFKEKVSIKVESKPLRYVLDQLLDDLPFKYQYLGGEIVIQYSQFSEDSSENKIEGVIKSTSGSPIAGATIQIKGTSRGTVTDTEGHFSIDADAEDILIVSFIGYQKKEVKIIHQTFLEIILKEKISNLDEFVLNSGYYQTTEKLKTGSIGKVTAEEIENQPVTNPLATLSGRIPGLTVVQSNGVPGARFSVNIRGLNSISQGNDPLFIIDGVPFAPNNNSINTIGSSVGSTGLSPFVSLNPSDIESIEVLKDADATAIYGSRGANGVVLITTKKGKSGKINFDLKVNRGMSKITRSVDWLDLEQYLEMRREAFKNDNEEMTESNAYDLLVWDTTRYTNWKDKLIGGTADLIDLQGALSGGSDHTRFLLSGSFRNESTVYPGDMGNTRGALHVNLDHSAPNDDFNVHFTTSFSSNKSTLITHDLNNYLANLPPNLPQVVDDDGNYVWDYKGYRFINPLALLDYEYEALTQNLLSNLKVGYQLSKGLSINMSLGYNTMNVDENRIYPIAAQNPEYNPTGSSRFGDSFFESLIIEPKLKYQTNIGKGTLIAMGGGTWQKNISKSKYIYARGYTSDALLKTMSGANSFSTSDSFHEYKYVAGFARINYNWNDKYIINLTGRRDGSSRFGSGKRFANFGALGAAWIFSKELSTNLPWLSFGKVRLSYGTSGNDQIGDYQYLETFSSTQYPYNEVTGLYPTRLQNANYGWEVNRKFESAVELGFIDDLLFFNFTYYQNRSDNQLVSYNLPSQTGFSSIVDNLPALVQNTGIEMQVSLNNLKIGKFDLTASANLTIPKNKLLEYPDIESSSYRNTYEIGRSLYIQRGYKLIDTWVDTETGTYSYVLADGNYSISPDYPEDIVKGLADLLPDFYGGISHSVKFQNFSIEALWEFRKQTGNSYMRRMGSATRPGMIGNQPDIVLRRWQEPGDITIIPQYTQSYSSDTYRSYSPLYTGANNFFTDASFIRLKNIALTYQFPQEKLEKIKINGLNIFLQGQNILTITNYYGGDPETQSPLKLPPLKTITLGLNLNL